MTPLLRLISLSLIPILMVNPVLAATTLTPLSRTVTAASKTHQTQAVVPALAASLYVGLGLTSGRPQPFTLLTPRAPISRTSRSDKKKKRQYPRYPLESRENIIAKWQGVLQDVIQRVDDPLLLWKHLAYYLAFFMEAHGAMRYWAYEDQDKDSLQIVLPPGEMVDIEDLPAIGAFLREVLHNKGGFNEVFGFLSPFLILLTSFVEQPMTYADLGRRARLLIGDDQDEILLADFTEAVSIVRHIRGNGMHWEEGVTPGGAERPQDNELLIEVIRDFIPRLRALSPEKWNAPVATRPGHSEVKIRFGDLMLWGLAHALDIRIQDPSIVCKFNSGQPVTSPYQSPEAIRDFMADMMRRALVDLDEVDSFGNKTGRTIDPAWIAELIQKTIKTHDEWAALGLTSPAEDVDWAPGTMMQRVMTILQDPTEPLRDAIMNIALASQQHQTGMVYSYAGSWPATVRKEYLAKYGSNWEKPLRTLLEEAKILSLPKEQVVKQDALQDEDPGVVQDILPPVEPGQPMSSKSLDRWKTVARRLVTLFLSLRSWIPFGIVLGTLAGLRWAGVSGPEFAVSVHLSPHLLRAA